MIAARSDPRPSPEASLRLASRTILVTDDDISFRDIVRDVLEEAGATVHTAKSALEALQICQKLTARLDLVIVDVFMPLMDGLALAARLRGRTAAHILLMSSQLTPANPNDPNWPSDTTFLQKPFTHEELLAMACAGTDAPRATRGS